MTAFLRRVCIPIVLLYSISGYTKGDLRVSLLSFNGTQRAAYHDIFERFSQANPDINLLITGYEAERYKSDFDQWLTSEQHSDILYWFGGERLRSFVNQGLIEDITDIWSKCSWRQDFTPAALSSVTFEKAQYGLPIHYYPWAIYYKKSLFKRLNLSPPTTWESFLSASETLKSKNIAPIVIGSKNYWTLAAWFDYINLRVNGLAFHQKLVSGNISYQDARVVEVFRYWQKLIDNKYYISDHDALTWREALPYLYREKGGMMLMGNFWISQIPKSLYHDIQMVPFPQIDPSLPFFEEAPTNVWVIPTNTQNKPGAIRLLHYLSKPEVQQELNQRIGMKAVLKGQPCAYA